MRFIKSCFTFFFGFVFGVLSLVACYGGIRMDEDFKAMEERKRLDKMPPPDPSTRVTI